MWSPPTHSVSPTVPVAFALAELHGATGQQIITAVAKGLEIQGRMQYAGNQYEPEHLKFHPPGVAGAFGSAIVASELLGLDVNGMRHALGIHRQAGGAARIRQVRIVSPVMKYIDRPQPATGLDGKFSLQYTAAAAM